MSRLRISTEDGLDSEKALRDLLSSSKAVRGGVLKRAPELQPQDARAVLQGLTAHCHRIERLDIENSPLGTTLEFVKVRTELATDLIQVLTTWPLSTLGPGIPPQVAGLKTAFPDKAGAIDGILSKWSLQKDYPMLAASAKRMLER